MTTTATTTERKMQFWVNMGNWYPGGSRPGVATWLKSFKNNHDSPATTTEQGGEEQTRRQKRAQVWFVQGDANPFGSPLTLTWKGDRRQTR